MKAHYNSRLNRWLVTLPDGRTTYRYRALMEEHLGRRLRTDEHVHHINGNQTDDRLENLVVLSAEEHVRLHTPDRVAGARAARGGTWGPNGVERCVECGTDQRPHVSLGHCGRCYYRNRARIQRGGGPRKPAVIIDYVCEGCGVSFSRPRGDGHGFRFCGKPCASRASATRRWAKRRAGEETAIGSRKPVRNALAEAAA